VNAWLVAAGGMSLSFIPCAVVCLRGRSMDRLVGLEMTAICNSLVLLLLAEGFQRTLFFDAALSLALLGFGGSLVFARFLERWL
jgi:multisubunit Na+/H+ antiporter MnhF subunit